MDIVIFGANGQTGRLLTRRALDNRHSVTAVTRHPDDFPFSDPLLTVVRADVRERLIAGRGRARRRCRACPPWACRSAPAPSTPTRWACATSSARCRRLARAVWSR